MKKIAIVEDDETIRKELVCLLKNANYDAFCIEDFSNVDESLFASNADLVLLDINIPCLNGKEVLKNINLEIQEGEFVAVIGKNGSRKINIV